MGKQPIWRSSMPMADIRRDQHGIPGMQCLYRLALPLHPANTGQAIECLADWMGMLNGSGAGREGSDAGSQA
jgi:hypothetical protein